MKFCKIQNFPFDHFGVSDNSFLLTNVCGYVIVMNMKNKIIEKEFDYSSKYVAYIQLTNWGFALGGEHYTVTIKCEKNSIDQLHYKLSRSEALLLNKKDGGSLFGSRYMVGEGCSRFFTKEKAIRHGIQASREKWKKLKIIIEGKSGTVQPQEIVWCVDEKIMKGANLLFDAMELLYNKYRDPWLTHEKMMEKINDKWEILLVRL